MPEFGTLLRSQRTLAVNSPYRGPNGPLHLMIDSTASRSRVRASGTHASMGRITGPSGGSGARDILKSLSKRWRFGPSRSLGVIPVMPRCCRICLTRSRRTRPSEASLQMVLSIPVNATTPSLTAGRMPSSPCKNVKPWKAVSSGAGPRSQARRASKYLSRAIWRNWTKYYRI